MAVEVWAEGVYIIIIISLYLPEHRAAVDNCTEIETPIPRIRRCCSEFENNNNNYDWICTHVIRHKLLSHQEYW